MTQKKSRVHDSLRRRTPLGLLVAALLSTPFVFVTASTVTSAVLHAQTAGEGAIQGTVADTTGAVVPNAKVTARNQASGVVTTRTTTGDGLYTISPLIPGKYDISVSAAGLATHPARTRMTLRL